MRSAMVRHSKLSASALLAIAIFSLAAFQLTTYSNPSGEVQTHSPKGLSSQLSQLARFQAYPYDEQVGTTFAQNFNSLAFNVTAVPQTGPDGVGPAYLLNGLTDAGYWYQVGLSYNWPHTTGGVSPGFNMNYEVFSPYPLPPHSIFPTSGGGLQTISVNSGDTVLLSLNFTGGNVLMNAYDWETQSSASQLFTAFSASHFIGLTGSNNQNGFFTGLMTEQYHSQPFNGTGRPVTYASNDSNVSSVWMWMDEFNIATGQSVFQDGTTSPVPLYDATSFQFFSSNGTAEAVSSNELVTGLSPTGSLLVRPAFQPVATPGKQASLTLSVYNPDFLNARITGLKVSNGATTYNTTATLPFTVNTRSANFTARFAVPATTPLGNYTLTILVSWQFLDLHTDQWIAQPNLTTSGTVHIRESGGSRGTGGSTSPPTTPSTNPPHPTGPTTPPSIGNPGPQNTTSRLLTGLRGILISMALGFVALATLAVVLVVREERRLITRPVVSAIRFCIACGAPTDSTMLFCPSCGHPTVTGTPKESSASGANPPAATEQSTLK